MHQQEARSDDATQKADGMGNRIGPFFAYKNPTADAFFTRGERLTAHGLLQFAEPLPALSHHANDH